VRCEPEVVLILSLEMKPDWHRLRAVDLEKNAAQVIGSGSRFLLSEGLAKQFVGWPVLSLALLGAIACSFAFFAVLYVLEVFANNAHIGVVCHGHKGYLRRISQSNSR
jgi:hypothetical protein